MTLAAFITEKGPIEIAFRLKTSATCVYQWRDGKTCPKPEHIAAVVRLSRGRVTHREIIETYVKSQSKKR